MIYTITITAYRIAPRVDTADVRPVYVSVHRSPRAAARRLASIIRGRTPLARAIAGNMPRDYSGRYLIVTPDGEGLALIPFRATLAGS